MALDLALSIALETALDLTIAIAIVIVLALYLSLEIALALAMALEKIDRSSHRRRGLSEVRLDLMRRHRKPLPLSRRCTKATSQ